MKLVQIAPDLLHLESADLDDAAGVDASLLAAFRAYLARVLDDQHGVAILTPAAGAHRLLAVLARRVGAALRDSNIHLRDSGGDLKAGRKKLCYLPGSMLGAALESPRARETLVSEAACFFQDLDGAWETGSAAPVEPGALLALIDERLAAGRPTFLNAAPDRLPSGLEEGLRARLPILETPRS